MKKPFKKFIITFTGNNNRSGQALLLSLLIMAGITAAGVGFATIIISQIKSAENIDNSITASYAAESGLEKALHIVKMNRSDSTKTLADTVSEVKSVTKSFTEIPGLTVEFDESGISSEELYTRFSLKKDESNQIDFYNPDDSFGANTGIDNLYISWDNNDRQIGDLQYSLGFDEGQEWVEVSWTGWNIDGTSFENVEKVLIAGPDLDFLPGLCPSEEFFQCRKIILDPESVGLSYYQIRVKALNEDIEDIEIRALNNLDEFVNIPSRIKLKTIGKYGRTQQALNASLPWKIPVSGIFDYVIFSEEQINKQPENNFQTSGKIEIESGILEGNAVNICRCDPDVNGCSLYPSCSGGCEGFGFVAEYWEPYVSCNKNVLADVGNNLQPSGWGTCDFKYEFDSCLGDSQDYTVIEKLVTDANLPLGEGDYYISLRGLYNSNQNSEHMKVTIVDATCEGLGTCQTMNVKDLYSKMANPAVTEYKSCVSPSKFHLAMGDKIVFEFAGDDEQNIVKLDWYQFSNGVPTGVGERCDSIPLRIEIEDNITKAESAEQCKCNSALCDEATECVTLGWSPESYGDSTTPSAECFRYSNESIFPTSGPDAWDVENLANGWGSCAMDTDRWVKYEVPAVTSGPYYLSIRAGFVNGDENFVRADVYDSDPLERLTDTFISSDLWGSANTPSNAFVECTFPDHIYLETDYKIRLSAPNDSVFLDWIEISETPPGYTSCNGSPIPYNVIP